MLGPVEVKSTDDEVLNIPNDTVCSNTCAMYKYSLLYMKGTVQPFE